MLLLAVVLGTLLTGAVGAASTARVTITDSALSPTAARVDVGGKVTWTNTGQKQHRVTSSAATFPAFTLQSGKAKTVTFAARRCERYTVDDRLNGRVLVGVATCPGGTTPPPPGGGGGGGGGGNTPPPKGGEATHRYNVKTIASVEEVQDTYEDLNANSIGVQTTKISWTGTWANMRVRVINGDDLNISGNAKGSIAARYSYADTRPQDRCNQSKIKALKGTASVGAWLGRDRDSSVRFDSRADFFNVSLCDRGPETLVGVVNPATVGGLVLQIDECCGIFLFKREGRGMYFPIDRLRDGKTFTVRSPLRVSSHNCGSGPLKCREKMTWSASVAFTPVR